MVKTPDLELRCLKKDSIMTSDISPFTTSQLCVTQSQSYFSNISNTFSTLLLVQTSSWSDKKIYLPLQCSIAFAKFCFTPFLGPFIILILESLKELIIFNVLSLEPSSEITNSSFGAKFSKIDSTCSFIYFYILFFLRNSSSSCCFYCNPFYFHKERKGKI